LYLHRAGLLIVADSIAKRVSANNGLSYQCPVTKKIRGHAGRACFTGDARVKIDIPLPLQPQDLAHNYG
tara:strand:+ start:92 stop:298 length:207 start_codon:yes stop_codon:yes gene_type:complete